MIKKHKNIKLKKLLIYTLVAAVISLGNAYAVTYLYGAHEISYSNSSSGLSASNVQDALDQVYAAANDYAKLKRMIYPVGSIYISVTDDTVAKVQSKFGGTWEVFGNGKALVGVNTNDSNYNTVEKIGGSNSAALTESNMPAHTHTVTAKGTISNTFTGTSTNTNSTGAHTHSVTAKGTISNTFTGSSTNTSSITLSGTMSLHGAETSSIIYGVSGVFSGGGGATNQYRSPIGLSATNGARSYGTLNINASHSHTVTAKGTVTSTFTGSSTNTGSNGSHTHTLTPSGTVSSTFTGTSTNTNSVGSGSSFSILQPYITVYMYKRTA